MVKISNMCILLNHISPGKTEKGYKVSGISELGGSDISGLLQVAVLQMEISII